MSEDGENLYTVKMGDIPVRLSEAEWWLADKDGNLIHKESISKEMIEYYNILNKGRSSKV